MKFMLFVVIFVLFLVVVCVLELFMFDVVVELSLVVNDICGVNGYLLLIGQMMLNILVLVNKVYCSYCMGDFVIMDYNFEWLNFEYVKIGKLVCVSCG